MVKHQLVARGINDENVLKAFINVPRHKFVPAEFHHLSYNDSPLSIGEGQTISQPYIVALMLQILELKSSDKVHNSRTFLAFRKQLIKKGNN